MTPHLTLPRRLLFAPLLAFAAGLVVLSILARGGAPLPAPEPPVAYTARLTGTSADIPVLQREVRAAPARADLRVSLAAAYLQRVRETADPAFYTRAGGVLAPALAAHPNDADVLTEAGLLALSRHDFRGALALGQRARAAQPDMADVSAVLVDALVELGRYGPAATELQRMVDSKPNLAAYARISYLRELHGDLVGAASAMRLAVAAGGPAQENVAYVSAQLGELERQLGHPAAAKLAFDRALAAVPHNPVAEQGLARLGDEARFAGTASPRAEARVAGAAAPRAGVAAAAAPVPAADIARRRAIVDRLPLPEYVIGLGEAELAAGRTAAGQRDLALVGAEETLLKAAGVNTDTELAVYEADHGDRQRAVALAQRAWAQSPSVRAADALGWALTQSGDPQAGVTWAHRALRLGSLDPLLRMHAGLSALAAGQRSEGRKQLALAFGHGLDGWPWQAQRARKALR